VRNDPNKPLVVPKIGFAGVEVHQYVNDIICHDWKFHIESLLVIQVQGASVLAEVSTVGTLFLASKSRASMQCVLFFSKTNTNPLSHSLHVNSKVVV